MKLMDMSAMPGFSPAVGAHAHHSVSEGRVYLHSEWKVVCREHGAMNAVNEECTIWRCLICHVAAYARR